jgi:isoleucyl-tRNA synthetase
MSEENIKPKSDRALREEAMLAFWKENDIFAKTLSKESPKGEFVFYEGPPTANAKPALHHLEARAFKDVLPRYKTMQGFHVRRRAGWDTHGLPVELQIEKKLGLTSKKDIEKYGIAQFNKECKESVFTYIKDWEQFTDRIGYWVDKSNAYYTFDASYMESLWNIVGKVAERDLLYKDYKVVPWCPRCGTALASHELAQGYQDEKDLSVTAKFELVDETGTYFLAWTTTPWTLPGNVGLAVGADIEYVKVKTADDVYILAKERLESVFAGIEYEVLGMMHGKELVGISYKPLYPYLGTLINGTEQEKMANAYKVYVADFVTTADGTGIVHTAVMYGADDFELGTKVGLPKFHMVDEGGHFISGTDFLEGRFVKDEDVAVDIIKDLAHRGLLFKKEKYEHSYPHCWRCKTPLIYYARDSWYIRMSSLRDELVKENEGINWEPAHIKEGRFGEWLREIKDWAISRERYWGTPLPIWESAEKDRVVVDSIETIKKYTKTSGNRYILMRHGESVHNVKNVWGTIPNSENDILTDLGKDQAKKSAQELKKIDVIITSTYRRSTETAMIAAQTLGLDPNNIVTDARIGEWNVGPEFEAQIMDEYFVTRNKSEDRYHYKAKDGESYADVFARVGEFLYDLESKYQGKTILIVTHGGAARAMEYVAHGFAYDTLFQTTRDYRNFNNAETREITFVPLPHNNEYELDLHRPYIDDVVLYKDGKEYRRVKEVMDVWFDSGSMPFAQDHYPFENKEWIESTGYPADFISEAIDQTRGWFYTLHAVGILMGRGKAYRNVICLGHLLDAQGKKMSKSIGNIVEPFEQMDKFGVDAVRFWMYSVNQPGDSKNYDEKTVDEVVKKVFNLLGNVHAFYELYRDTSLESGVVAPSTNILDQWILARLNQLITVCTENLDRFKLFEPTRAIREFVDDLSTWYLRRSRDRMKEGDTEAKQTMYVVLKTVTQLLAPFAPFTAEDMWRRLKTESDEESVHLSVWPTTSSFDESLIVAMETTREICTIGNALRKKENIPVRQPLQSLTVANLTLTDAYLELIKEELNLKEVRSGEETALDTTITPELKAEGNYRELIRAVQDLRKAQGLQPGDVIAVTISSEAESTLNPFIEEFKKTVQASAVTFAVNDGDKVTIDGTDLIVTIER